MQKPVPRIYVYLKKTEENEVMKPAFIIKRDNSEIKVG